MSDKETWPTFVQELDNHKYRIRRPERKCLLGFELFLVDFTEWKLRFSDKTPLIWVKTEVMEPLSNQQLLEGLQDVANQQGWRHQECLVLLEGDGTDLCRRTAEGYFPRFVIIDLARARAILAAHGFTAALLDWITDQVPISNLSPYQISQPAEGSAFFGRAKELDRILRQDNASFAILGIRRIGKTSLLREAYRRLGEQGGAPERLVWLDCSTLAGPEHFVQEVVRQMNFREMTRLKDPAKYLFHFPSFLQRMSKKYGGRITIFLDEVDSFLKWSSGFSELLSTLRQSINARACRYVLAGFIDLTKELFDYKSPWYTLFEQLHLGPFEAQETEDLVLRPMRSLRIRFRNESAVVARIQDDTQGHPLLVQFYCQQLIQRLERDKVRDLGPDHVEGIYDSEYFKQFVVNTFRDNVSKSDKLLVYTLLVSFPATKITYTQPEMHFSLQRHGCPQSVELIDQACDRLVMAGILAHSGQQYCFANQALPRALRVNYNLRFLLETTKKELRL